jgi:Endonuclease/Exonuclease/phosphatase family
VRVEAHGKSISVLTTHTIAQYNIPDPYISDRLSQVFELARWVEQNTRNDSLVVVMGDLNFQPPSLEYDLLRSMTGLHDSHVEANLGGDYVRAKSQELTVDNGGFTIMDSNVDEELKRLDYIWVGSRGADRWKVDTSDVCMTHDEFFFSDHMGVTARLSLESGSSDERERAVGTAKSQFEALGDCAQRTLQLMHGGIAETKARAKRHVARSAVGVLVWLLLHGYGVRHSVPLLLVDVLVAYCVFELYTVVLVVRDELASRIQLASEVEYFATGNTREKAE